MAHYFVDRLHEEGIEIKCIYNRTIWKANELAERCGSIATDSLISIPHSNLIIVAVSDDHIQKVAEELYSIHNDVALIHTSGALTLEVFPDQMQNVGCIWPLQSIKKGEKYNRSEVPLCIDANNTKFRNSLKDLCDRISDDVIYLPSEKKKYAHVAAVLSNNFSNHLLSLSEEYCTQHSIDFGILKPLILSSLNKIKTNSPKELQTGPARRMDMNTINDHMDMIADPQTKKIYREITRSILKTYHENS